MKLNKLFKLTPVCLVILPWLFYYFADAGLRWMGVPLALTLWCARFSLAEPLSTRINDQVNGPRHVEAGIKSLAVVLPCISLAYLGWALAVVDISGNLSSAWDIDSVAFTKLAAILSLPLTLMALGGMFFHGWLVDTWEISRFRWVATYILGIYPIAFMSLQYQVHNLHAVYGETVIGWLFVSGILILLYGMLLMMVQASIQRMLAYLFVATNGLVFCMLAGSLKSPHLIDVSHIFLFVVLFMVALVFAALVFDSLQSPSATTLLVDDLAALKGRNPWLTTWVVAASFVLMGIVAGPMLHGRWIALTYILQSHSWFLLMMYALTSLMMGFSCLRLVHVCLAPKPHQVRWAPQIDVSAMRVLLFATLFVAALAFPYFAIETYMGQTLFLNLTKGALP